MTKPKQAAAKARRGNQTKVAVEFDYDEASLLVVATNVLFGLMPDKDIKRVVERLVDKLYTAEPRLKADARRIEGEMRQAFGPDNVDIDPDEDMEAPLHGDFYLNPIHAAMQDGRALSLMRKDGVIVLRPTGVGQIGDVAIAIGWSATHEDYTLVRLDEVVGIGLESRSERPAAIDPTGASLDRLCRKPPVRGGPL